MSEYVGHLAFAVGYPAEAVGSEAAPFSGAGRIVPENCTPTEPQSSAGRENMTRGRR